MVSIVQGSNRSIDRNSRTSLTSSRRTAVTLQEQKPSCCCCSFLPESREDTARHNLQQATRMLTLLREYEARFGMPDLEEEHEDILIELCQRGSASGIPVWVLQPTLGTIAQALLKSQNVGVFINPRTALLVHDSMPRFFKVTRDRMLFHIVPLERILVRLATFTTNTRVSRSIADDFLPNLLQQNVSQSPFASFTENREEMAQEILDLSAQGYGFFFLLQAIETLKRTTHKTDQKEHDEEAVVMNGDNHNEHTLEIHSFWDISPTTKQLFKRLVAMETRARLDALKLLPSDKQYYPRHYTVLYRSICSATSSVLWFSGSWQDMICSGLLAAVITYVFQTNPRFWKDQRLIFEVVVGFVVGLTTGLLSIRWQSALCFNALAFPAIIDYLRGFGAVFSIMEVMSKNTMLGAADLLEAVVFSFLLGASILLGLSIAERIMHVDTNSDSTYYSPCLSPIPEIWYILVAPLACTAWASSFHPRYVDIPLMAMHGIIAYTVSRVVLDATGDPLLSSLIASFSLTSVAGLVSRVSGRQALGNTYTGLYTLVPGVFVVNRIFDYTRGDSSAVTTDFVVGLILRAAAIGVGAWMGTLACAPAYLGTTLSSNREASLLHM